jgi:hypothetical protein
LVLQGGLHGRADGFAFVRDLDIETQAPNAQPRMAGWAHPRLFIGWP